MNDVAALEFTRQHAQPIPAERREELLATPGFGDAFSDHMVTVRWPAEVGWHDAKVGPLAALSLHPATMALHYGQTIFEGMKAFWRPNGQRALFRPVDHARRFNSSARRMAMPTLPEEDFVAALEALLQADGAWVPRARGHSFYLRPFMIAAETHLGLRPAEEYLFAVIGTPARPASAGAEAHAVVGSHPSTSVRRRAVPVRPSVAATMAAPSSPSDRLRPTTATRSCGWTRKSAGTSRKRAVATCSSWSRPPKAPASARLR